MVERRYRTGAMTVAALLAIAGCSLCAPPTPQPVGCAASAAGPLRAGAAAVDIALPAGTPLAGYGGTPHRRQFTATTVPLNLLALGGTCLDPTPGTAATFFEPASGTKDPISARALVISNRPDDSNALAFVKLDTVGVSRRLRDDLTAAAQPLGIPPEQLVVVATHTHSGPGAVADAPLYQVLGTDCLAGAVYAPVRDAAVAALTAAHAALQPAKIGIARVTVANANQNRRGRPAVVDSELALLKVTTASGAPVAALFNFAVHGTSLKDSNMELSADCMGVMEDVVEAAHPGVVAIFTNAAEGDVAPMQPMQAEGQLVGDAVNALWAATPAATSAAVLCGALMDVDMPAPSYNAFASDPCPPLPGSAATLCSALGWSLAVPIPSHWVPDTLPFQALRIDDAVFAAVPGEPITEIGWELKARGTTMGFAHAIVLGLANDHGGYFTTLSEYQRAEYEGRSTIYGPTTGDVVVQSADAVMQQVE